MPRRILIVCVGNICRSPMGAVLLQRYRPNLEVGSAGLAALGGSRIHPLAQAVLREHDLDASGHVARQLYDSLIVRADLTLAMERAHVHDLVRHLPSLADRIRLLGEWLPEPDIEDPYGQDRAAFEYAYRHIDAGLRAWLPHLDAD